MRKQHSCTPVATPQPLFAQLDSCIDTTITPPPPCPGHREAFWNGEKKLIKDLAICGAVAQAKVFDKITQDPGLKTKNFLDYLQAKTPQFYDGTKSRASLVTTCQAQTGLRYLVCALGKYRTANTIALPNSLADNGYCPPSEKANCSLHT